MNTLLVVVVICLVFGFLWRKRLVRAANIRAASFIAAAQAGQSNKANAAKAVEFPKAITHNVTLSATDEQMNNPIPSSTPLSPFDLLNALPLNFLYLYENKLDEAEVMTALSAVLKWFPQLGGVLTVKDKEVIIDCAGAVGVPVTVCHTENEYDLSSMYASHPTNVLKFVDTVVATGYPFSPGNALMKIRITHFNSSNSTYKTALGISVNHAVVDGHSFFHFMSLWAAKCRQADFCIPVPNHNRDQLIIRKGLSNNTSNSSIAAKQAGYIYQPFIPRLWGAIKALKFHGKCNYVHLHFSHNELQNMKQLVTQQLQQQQQQVFISTNDVMCCHVWKALAQLRTKEPPEANFPLVFVANFREISFHAGNVNKVGSNYFGNATVFGKIDMTRQEVIDSSLKDLVLKMHATVTDIKSGKIVENSLNFLNYQQHSQGLASYAFISNPIEFSGVFVTDWRHFDVYDVDFGSGRPAQLFFPTPPLPWLNVITPEQQQQQQQQQGGGGAHWQMSIPLDYLDKLPSNLFSALS